MDPKCPIINIASAELLQKLDRIEPGVWGTPCTVTLRDGFVCRVCLAWENKRYSDLGEWLNPNQVADIAECDFRMPARFAHMIWDAGESGMGYHIYVVDLTDGISFAHVAGNLVIDLVDLPDGYTARDIINVHPHEGRERTRTAEGYRQVRDYQTLEYTRRQ